MEARDLLEKAGSRSILDESYSGQLIEKWEQKGLIGKINNQWTKKVTAILLENQYSYQEALTEDTTYSANAGAFTKYTFPILRRVFPNLIANEIVSVQPMTAPVGAVFNYEVKYDQRKGTKFPQQGISNNPYDIGYEGELQSKDNMIQNFAKYYSSEFVDYDSVCTDTATSTATLNQAAANCREPEWKPIRAPGVLGQRTFYVKAYYRAVDAGKEDKIATLDPTGATNNLVDNYGETVGTFDVSTGNWTITPLADGGAPANFEDNTVVWLQYFFNSELVGDVDGAKIPSVSLDIQMTEVRAEPHRLRAQWSTDAAEDLKALHGIDAEVELVANTANEIQLEIDRTIVDDLLAGAIHSASYTYSNSTPGELESIRQMITQLSALSSRIHTSTGRAPANFIVCSTAVEALLQQLTTHGDYKEIEQNVQSPSYGPMTANFGVTRVGTLLNKWAVYRNPYMHDSDVLMGLRGNSFLDAGYCYSPYVPLQVTPTFHDPDDFRFKKGMWTRHATKMLRPEYYGKLTVAGLPSVVSDWS